MQSKASSLFNYDPATEEYSASHLSMLLYGSGVTALKKTPQVAPVAPINEEAGSKAAGGGIERLNRMDCPEEISSHSSSQSSGSPSDNDDMEQQDIPENGEDKERLLQLVDQSHQYVIAAYRQVSFRPKA